MRKIGVALAPEEVARRLAIIQSAATCKEAAGLIGITPSVLSEFVMRHAPTHKWPKRAARAARLARERNEREFGW